jgi:hypothetical protein
MGRLISMNESSTVIMMKQAVMEFNYEAFNAQQNAFYEQQERHMVKDASDAIKRQKKLITLKAEYATLKEVYFKTLNDCRLKQSTREARCEDIVNAMITIEDILCI